MKIRWLYSAAIDAQPGPVIMEGTLPLQELMKLPVNTGFLLIALPQGLALAGNACFSRMSGYDTPSSLALSQLLDDKAGLVAHEVLQALGESGHWSGEVHLRRRDGSGLWVLLSGSLLESAHEGGIALLVMQDFSKQKLLLQESELRRQLHQRAQKLALIGHWELDIRRGELVFGTDELYRIFGLPTGAPMAEFDRVVHPADRESVNNMMMKTLHSGGIYDSTYRLITADGERKWVHAIGEGIFDAQGNLVAIAGSVQDITAFREVEEELIRMQKLKSLGLLAGGIAHDFNNIHTLLFGNIELAKSRMQSGQAGLAELELAEKALSRANVLSNQLLTFAKGGEPIKQRLHIDKLIEGVVRLDMAGSKAGYHVEVEPGLWQVDADPGQLEQVFTNLVLNALQAMPNGGRLQVSMANARLTGGERVPLKPGTYVQIRLSDNGVGIDKAYLPQIFDPYFSTRKGGTGLGLATAYSIISRHGGHIEASSQLGAGTTFVMYLPAIAEETTEKAAQQGKQQVAPTAQRVLVMDDEEELCTLLQKVLELDGYDVVTSADGEAAIREFDAALRQGLPFACVIMDLTIPGAMGGKEAVQEILKLSPAAKVIVSSGYAEDPVLANFAEYGFKGVIPKPYMPSAMRRIVKDVLAQ